MKNKKLFAILTLVCFMFTLMPVAAFAAPTTYVDVEDDYKLVDVNEDVVVNVGPVGTNDYIYVFAVDSTGALTKEMDVVRVNSYSLVNDKSNETTVDGVEWIGGVANAANVELAVQFASEGDYTIYAAPSADLTNGVAAVVNDPKLTRAQKLGLLKDEAFKNLDTVVTVKPSKTEYHFSATANHAANDAVETLNKNVAKANGVAKADVTLYLHNADGDAVVGQDVTISTNSSAVDVSATKIRTNAAGEVDFDITATIAGEYEVYVEYGNKADVTVNVTVGTTGAADIEKKYDGGKVDVDTDLGETNMMFTITDINGNVIKNPADLGTYHVRVVEAPAGTSITNTAIANGIAAKEVYLRPYPAESAWMLTGIELDEEGDYTFKVILDNGASATANVTVKEFQTPVAIQLEYKAPSVELNGYNIMKALKFIDANGVKTAKGTAEIKLAATGYAVDAFAADAASLVKTVDYQIRTKDAQGVWSDWKSVNKLTYDATVATYTPDANGNLQVDNKQVVNGYAGQGTVKAKADEKYVGSTITVTAVSEKYNLVATTSMVVANEAAAVKYASTEADVAVNNTLTANIVDADGTKVALTSGVNKANISYIVLEKPENAKVAVSTQTEELAEKGQFKVSFTASEIGEYKVQTIVTYEQANGVIKYYSGIETITVGNTGFGDIVVMSVGSNEIVKNAETVTIDAAPIVENNRTFVPFRALAEAFGATVAFDEATQAVTAELNGTTVVMTIGAATYTVNGVEKTADVAPFINGSRTMVPVRFVAQAFGITVTPTYDDNGATADILFAK